MYEPVERENEIIETLKKLSDGGLDFVIVGGYAVSAFRHRFSVDADIVIKKEDKEKFEKMLRKEGYRKTVSKQLQNMYSSEFVRYEKREPRVSVDLLIGDLGSRQTGAAFSFEFLFKNSIKRPIEGIEKAVEARVPRREILIILKLHSGRLTDFRDIAALSFNLDMNLIRDNLFKGNQSIVRDNMKKLESLIEKPGFQDSFKGVFREKNYRINPDIIRKLARLYLLPQQ